MAKQEYIYVKGARQHNLQNIDVKLPRNKLVVITGLSGSGKSSLAFDTIYAAGQRQILPGLRHHLRRGPAALYGEPFLLCAPVFGADGEAGGGCD